ncbi:MAG: putative quinol monooxygenase [Actinomycetes bacterium]
MIYEHARIYVTPGREDEFLHELPRGLAIIQQADGFVRAEVFRGVEEPSTIFLRVTWESLEAHVTGFREGPLFAQWREVIGPFFSRPPEVDHVAPTGLVAEA